MASELSLLSQIAANISANAAKLDEYLKTNKLPQPGFGVDAPVAFEYSLEDPHAVQAKAQLANDGKKLYLLMIGHAELSHFRAINELYLLGALHTLCEFKVPQAVPLNGEISFQELASKTGFGLNMLTRFMRLATVNYVFEEARPGFIAHTAQSQLLATNEGARATMSFAATESLPSISRFAEALQQSPSGDIAPFSLAFGDSFFDHKKKNPAKAATFGKVMAGVKGYNRGQEVVNAFDWGQFDGTIVDIGGGVGHIATSIAKAYPKSKLLIEDMANLQSEADKRIALEGVGSQVTFISHDFFEPQPEQAKGAAVYFLSQILHDWPDEKCCRIMKQVVDVMAPESRIILCETLLPEPGQLLEYQEAKARALDLGMFSLLTAKERTVKDLEALLKSVDSRLKVSTVVAPPTMKQNSLVEFVLQVRDNSSK